MLTYDSDVFTSMERSWEFSGGNSLVPLLRVLLPPRSDNRSDHVSSTAAAAAAAAAAPAAAAVVVYDVGAHQGTFVDEVLQALEPERGGGGGGGSSSEHDDDDDGGGGSRTRAAPLIVPQGLEVHLFEPFPPNVDVLRQRLFSAADSNIKHDGGMRRTTRGARHVFLNSVALADETGTTDLFVESAFLESGSMSGRTFRRRGAPVAAHIPRNSTLLTVPVNVTTLDEYVAKRTKPRSSLGSVVAAAPHHAATIDVLKIDAEGVDALVLSGGAGLLSRQAIGAIIFEYGQVWTVTDRVDLAETNLRSVVELLDTWGYASYLAGRNRLLPVSRGCWAPEYETWWFQNIVSVSRRLPHADRLAERFAASLGGRRDNERGLEGQTRDRNKQHGGQSN